jgi:hypothetical protein
MKPGHNRRIFTADEVKDIRERGWKIPHRKLAKEYGVTGLTIWNIVSQKTYSELPPASWKST